MSEPARFTFPVFFGITEDIDLTRAAPSGAAALPRLLAKLGLPINLRPRQPRSGGEGRGTKEAVIAILAAPFGLAVVAWLAALLAGRAGGLIRLVAQAVAVVLLSGAGALAGFLIPFAPLPETGLQPALIAGVLGTLGTIAGMAVAEWLLTRLDRRAG